MSTMMLDSVVTRLCRIQFYVVLLYTEVKYDNLPGFGGWGNHIGVLSVGETRAFGKNSSKFWLMNLITSSWWLTQAIVRSIHMRREHEAAIRIWAAQNGVQHKTAFDRDPHGMPLRAIAAQGADCKRKLLWLMVLQRNACWRTREMIPMQFRIRHKDKGWRRLFRLKRIVESNGHTTRNSIRRTAWWKILKQWRDIATRYAKI